VRLIGGTGNVFARSELVAAFPDPPPASACTGKQKSGKTQLDPSIVTDPSWAEIKAALAYIPADDRDTWWRLGMTLHAHTQGGKEGYAVWDRWSRTAPDQYDSADQPGVARAPTVICR
jgi:hypothetical protein